MFGVGEGIVRKIRTRYDDAAFWFESKGDEFAVSAQSRLRLSALDIENGHLVRDFAQTIVTEIRLQQGWEYPQEMHMKEDMSGKGRSLQWLIEDCLFEEQREMAEANLEKQKLKPEIVRIAKGWYKRKVDVTT